MFRGEVRLNVEEKKTRAARERETRGAPDGRRPRGIMGNGRGPARGAMARGESRYTPRRWDTHITHTLYSRFPVLLSVSGTGKDSELTHLRFTFNYSHGFAKKKNGIFPIESRRCFLLMELISAHFYNGWTSALHNKSVLSVQLFIFLVNETGVVPYLWIPVWSGVIRCDPGPVLVFLVFSASLHGWCGAIPTTLSACVRFWVQIGLQQGFVLNAFSTFNKLLKSAAMSLNFFVFFIIIIINLIFYSAFKS